MRDLERFLAAFDNKHTLAIEAQLKTLKAPTEMVALAGRYDPRHTASSRVQGCQDLLPRGTLGGVQQGTTRILADGLAKGVMTAARIQAR
jgi:hypothetical protein